MYFNHTINNNNLYLTPSGFDNFKSMLKKLYSDQAHLGRELHATREPGEDIDNTAYTEIKNRSADINSHIQSIGYILKNATLIKRPQYKNVVELGNVVELHCGDEYRNYMIVGSIEADPSEYKLSDQCPVGKQLMGKHVGDKVEIGNGTKRTFTISAIR